ncbi:unnamed protein product [Lathyrus oleraceus]
MICLCIWLGLDVHCALAAVIIAFDIVVHLAMRIVTCRFGLCFRRFALWFILLLVLFFSATCFLLLDAAVSTTCG